MYRTKQILMKSQQRTQLILFLLLLIVGLAGVFFLSRTTQNIQRTQDTRSKASVYAPVMVTESQQETENGRQFKLHVRVSNTQAAYPSTVVLKTEDGRVLHELATTFSENQNQCELDETYVGTFSKYETDWFSVEETPQTEGYIAALDKGGYRVELKMTNKDGTTSTEETHISRICSNPLPMSDEETFDIGEEEPSEEVIE